MNLKEQNKMCLIMRKPVLMEDEGRFSFIKRCTEAEATQWVSDQEGQYFHPSDYTIIYES